MNHGNKRINLDDYEILKQAGEETIVLRKKKSKYPKWEELPELKGCYILMDSVTSAYSTHPTCPSNKATFLTQKHAKSAIAMEIEHEITELNDVEEDD